MSNEQKSIKEYAREAKQRMKSGFWENHQKNLEENLKKAEDSGVSSSKVIQYYTVKVEQSIKTVNKEDEEFYNKVKDLLEKEGEVSNAIGRLTDKNYYETLTYEQKQRYNLTLAEKYLKAVERYNKEKEMESVCK